MAKHCFIFFFFLSCFSSAFSDQACKIFFSPIPHEKTITNQTEHDAIIHASLSQQKLFAQTLEPLAHELLESLGIHGYHLNNIVGGYEGVSEASYVLSLKNLKRLPEIITVSASLGYIFYQDAVLMVCPDDHIKNDTDTILIEIDDDHDFFNEQHARFFYGLLIGANNSPSNLGYSYDIKKKTYSVLSNHEDTDNDLKKLKEAIHFIEFLSSKTMKFNVNQNTAEAAFISNDWSSNPSGESYSMLIEPQSTRNTLKALQKKHTDVVRQFLDSQLSMP